jgi:hypothetical protein
MSCSLVAVVLSAVRLRRVRSARARVWAVTRGQLAVPLRVTPVTVDRKDRAACVAAMGAPKQRFDLVVDVIGRDADDARQDVELFRDQASQLVFVSLVTREIGLCDALNENPGGVPFSCHRIY